MTPSSTVIKPVRSNGSKQVSGRSTRRAASNTSVNDVASLAETSASICLLGSGSTPSCSRKILSMRRVVGSGGVPPQRWWSSVAATAFASSAMANGLPAAS
ncbi:Uncharacterised protein [Mycobacteroides abscessus subsp. abscessus]|nr:Uncharacterised protein [Mycobacteroides abscessus subsp. abscessus]